MRVYIYWRCMYGILTHTTPITHVSIWWENELYHHSFPFIIITIIIKHHHLLNHRPHSSSSLITILIIIKLISIYLSFHLFIGAVYLYPSIDLSTYLFIYLSIYQFIYAIYLSIKLSFHELGIQGMIAEVHLRRIERLTVSTVQVNTSICVTNRESALRLCSL